MRSIVSGVAGSVRLKQLTAAGLTMAERHGKRLDKSGKARAVNDTPALTRTGLDLNELYRAHVEGAFIPSAKAKAMHMILQFPKELVDPTDASGMLDHARAYAERVFGPDAVFADRIDRDETNTQVVDLFIAPKYLKRTKRSEKLSVSMSRHLKKLAEKHGHPPLPQGIGRAMQDELFEYFRDVMKLGGVERGARKTYPGPDWKSAEQQRLEELEEIEGTLQRERVAVREQATELAERFEDLNARICELAEREQAIEAREQGLDSREWDLTGREARVEADQASAGAARQDADAAAQSVQADRRLLEFEQAETTRAQAERDASLDRRAEEADERERATSSALAAARIAQAAVDQARAEMDAALRAAVRFRDAAAAEAAEAKLLHDAARAERDKAASERDRLAAERSRLESEGALHEAQIALLARGVDDDAGLNLRLTDEGISMRAPGMRDAEREIFSQPWSVPMVRIARQLARALEQMRDRARQLLTRERAIEQREAAVVATEREIAYRRIAQRREHDSARADLERRSAAVRIEQERAASLMAIAEARRSASAEKEAAANAAVLRNQRWALALGAIDRNPDRAELTEANTIRLTEGVTAAEEPALAAVVGDRAPSWALSMIVQRLDLADSTRVAVEHEQQAKNAAERLAEMVQRAGPVLTAAEQEIATEAARLVRRLAPNDLEHRSR